MILGQCTFCKKEFRKRERKYKFCSLKCANNFNKNGLKNVLLPSVSTRLAELVGICLGDGYVSPYQIAITLNSEADKQYIPYVVNLISTLFPEIKISLIKRKKENATDIRISSKIVAEFLLNMGIIPKRKTVPSWIYSKEEYRSACIRGLFDTEGSISFKDYRSKKGTSLYKQLNFRNYNKELILFVRDSLLSLGIRPTLSLKNSLYISNDKDIDIFCKKIGFSNPKLQQRSIINNMNDLLKMKEQTKLIELFNASSK